MVADPCTELAPRATAPPHSHSLPLIQGDAANRQQSPRSQSELDLARRNDEVAVLVVHGQVDLHRAHRLGTAINEALSAKPAQLVIDLRNVELVDSAGLAVLVHARRRMLRRRHRLTLVCDVPRTLRVLEITGLDRVFDIHRTLDAALQSRTASAPELR